jgi:hypothetical protein
MHYMTAYSRHTPTSRLQPKTNISIGVRVTVTVISNFFFSLCGCRRTEIMLVAADLGGATILLNKSRTDRGQSVN